MPTLQLLVYYLTPVFLYCRCWYYKLFIFCLLWCSQRRGGILLLCGRANYLAYCGKPGHADRSAQSRTLCPYTHMRPHMRANRPATSREAKSYARLGTTKPVNTALSALFAPPAQHLVHKKSCQNKHIRHISNLCGRGQVVPIFLISTIQPAGLTMRAFSFISKIGFFL